MKKETLYILMLSIVVAVFSLLVFYSKGQGCVVRNATGLHCPGCGGKRALGQLADGNFLYSLQCNLLLIPALLMIGWILLSLVFKRSMKQLVITKRVSLMLFIIATAYTIVRNIGEMEMLRP